MTVTTGGGRKEYETTQIAVPDKPIRLGNVIKDAVTGFTGTAFQKVEQLNGNVQWTIMPQIGEDGKFPDAWAIDQNMVDYIGEGLADRVPPIPETPFSLGDKVRDKTNGYTGTVVARTVFINGCVIFTVSAESKKGGKDYGSVESIAWTSLEKIGEVKKVKEAAAKPTRTGGPVTRALTSR